MAHDSLALSPPFRPRSGSPYRHRSAWLAPAAAAAAVVIVAVCLVVFKSAATDVVSTSHASHPAATASLPASSTSAGIPEYYVSIAPLGNKHAVEGLVVADTFTGKTVVTIAPPAGRTFTSVSAAADDRTFVAYAMPASGSRGQAGSWYEVRLTPGAASPARLSRLRVPPLASVLSMAVSESGSELAVVIADPEGQPKSLTTYSVTTGRLVRSWPHGLFGFNSVNWKEGMPTPELTWIDGDRDIAFPYMPNYQNNNGVQTTWTAQIWHLNLSRAAPT